MADREPETPILRDIGPRNPPILTGEHPFIIWIRYGLGDLFYWIGMTFGAAWLDKVPEFLDALRFATLDALHEAKQRLAEPSIHTPVGIRIDTTDLKPTANDTPPE